VIGPIDLGRELADPAGAQIRGQAVEQRAAQAVPTTERRIDADRIKRGLPRGRAELPFLDPCQDESGEAAVMLGGEPDEGGRVASGVIETAGEKASPDAPRHALIDRHHGVEVVAHGRTDPHQVSLCGDVAHC